MTVANRTVKHFALHRLDDVELRVISDVESGSLRLEQAEIDVVSRLAADLRWRHETVTLYVLSDLQPLQRQLEALGRTLADSRPHRPEELLSRPVVNVYDLASPATCNVFVNRQAMEAAGYWEDTLSIQGLLAHEHAHPLAECPHTATLRRLQIASRLELETAWAPDPVQARTWAQRAQQQVAALVAQLYLTGPREVFTNEIAIASGFSQGLYHLNRENVRNLVTGLKYRLALVAQLSNLVAAGQLSREGAALLQFIGDLQAYLQLAMEIAPFRRAGFPGKARELVKPLYHDVFPQLEPEVRPLFRALMAVYTHMGADASAAKVKAAVEDGLAQASKALARYDARLVYAVEEIGVKP